MKHWFVNKTYGYGWTPATWQGWLVIAGYVVLSIETFLVADAHSHSASDTLLVFVPLYVIYTFVLLIVCFLTGEKPRWRWGK